MENKSSSVNDDIIDLTIIFKKIWEGKVKIFFITLISVLLGFGYYSQIPDSFQNSLIIKQSNKFELTKLTNLLEFIYDGKNDSIISELPQKFVDKLQNINELILKDKKSTNEEVMKLSDKEREYDYSNLLNFKKINDNEFIISLKWHDSKEGSKILEKIIIIILNNIQNSFYDHLYTLLDNKKKNLIRDDNRSIKFLLEQRSIAKDLNIIEHEIDHIISLSDLFIRYDRDTNLSTIYLRGVNYLDNQIEIIKKRKYTEITDIREEINSFRKAEIDLIDYKNEKIKVESLKKKPKSILFQSFLLGLIFGIFYVLILSVYQSQTASRKITN